VRPPGREDQATFDQRKLTRKPADVKVLQEWWSTKGRTHLGKNEKTSTSLGKLASQVLRSPSSSSAAKRLAGSVLTQRPDRKK